MGYLTWIVGGAIVVALLLFVVGGPRMAKRFLSRFLPDRGGRLGDDDQRDARS